MASKKGHRQFKQIRHDIFNTNQEFPGYPHRQHRKNRPMFRQSEVGRARQTDHIRELEEELSQLYEQN